MNGRSHFTEEQLKVRAPTADTNHVRRTGQDEENEENLGYWVLSPDRAFLFLSPAFL